MSGNPAGRPKLIEDIRVAARRHAPEALAVLVKGLKARDERVRFVSATALLDRGYGRPAQQITGPAGGPVQVAAVVAHVDLRQQLRGLTDADLADLDRITRKLAAPRTGDPGPGGEPGGDPGGAGPAER